MTLFKKNLLLLVIISATLTAKAAYLTTDTTVRKNNEFAGSAQNTFSFNNITTGAALKDAVAAFRADSAEKGIHITARVFRYYDRLNHVTRALDYNDLEFFNLIAEADEGKFSGADKQLVQAFISSAFMATDSVRWQNFFNNLKKAPATLLSRRLNLLVHYFDQDKQFSKELAKMLKDEPNMVTVNMLKAEDCNNNSEYAEAIKYCNKVLTLAPQSASTFARRASAYDQLNDEKNAMADYDRSLQLFPNNKKVLYSQSCAFIDFDKYREAIPGLLKMYATNPDYLWDKYNLAKCYKMVEQRDSALYYVNQHILQHPDDDDGYDLKGDIFYEQKEYITAIEQYTQAIHLSPDRAVFFEDRGAALFYNSKYIEALADFKQAIRLDKHRQYANDMAGDCCYNLKDYRQALVFHNQALKIDPKYKYAYVGLSRSKVELGDYTGAIADCKKALVIDSTYDSAAGDLGWALYCNGDNEGCIKWSYKAIKLDSTATYAMFNIALATLRKGEPEKAKQLYTQFIAECKQKGYEISDGAIDDLRNLAKKGIAVADCKYIAEQLFGKEL